MLPFVLVLSLLFASARAIFINFNDQLEWHNATQLPSIIDHAFRIQSTDPDLAKTPFDGIWAVSSNPPSSATPVSGGVVYVRKTVNLPALLMYPSAQSNSPALPSETWVIADSTNAVQASVKNFEPGLPLTDPPPYNWAFPGTSPSIRVLLPGAGDVFLPEDNNITVQWASCNIGIFPHKVYIELLQNTAAGLVSVFRYPEIEDRGGMGTDRGTFFMILQPGWTGSDFVVRVQSTRTDMNIGATSGIFTLGGTPYVTSARRLLLNRFAPVLSAPSFGSAYQGKTTVRLQSLYPQAALGQAGLPLDQQLSALLLQVNTAYRQPLSEVRLTLYWVTDADLALLDPVGAGSVAAQGNLLNDGGTLVFGPEVLQPNRLTANAWLRLPCSDSDACQRRSTSDAQNLVVELSFVNAGLDTAGSFRFANLSSSPVASLRGNGAFTLTSYPYSSVVTLAAPAALLLRLERVQLGSDTNRCAAAQSLVVEPIPTVTRVTGPLAAHPVYGFYVLGAQDTVDYDRLVYRKTDNPSWQLRRVQNLVSGALFNQWELVLSNLVVFINTMLPCDNVPNTLTSGWKDARGNNPLLYAFIVPFLISKPIGPETPGVGFLFGQNFSVPIRPLVAARSMRVLLLQYTPSVRQLPDALPQQALPVTDLPWSISGLAPTNDAFALRVAHGDFDLLVLRTPRFRIDFSPLCRSQPGACNLVSPPVVLPKLNSPAKTNASLIDGQTAFVMLSGQFIAPGAQVQVEVVDNTTLASLTLLAPWAYVANPLANGVPNSGNLDPSLPVPATGLMWKLDATPLLNSSALRLRATLVNGSTVNLASTPAWQTQLSAPFTVIRPSPPALLGTPVQVQPRSQSRLCTDLLGVRAGPFNAVSANCQRIQSIYLPNDLGSIGLAAGSLIGGVSFRVSDLPDVALENVVIAYSWVTADVIQVPVPDASVKQSLFTTQRVVVLTALNFAGRSAGSFIPFAFNNQQSIYWDGSSGLVLEFSFCNQQRGTTGGSFLNPVRDLRSLVLASDAWSQLNWPYEDAGALPYRFAMDIQVFALCTSDSNCLNSGVCNVTSRQCQCKPGFFGPYCARACQANITCNGRGTCSPIDGTCVCNPKAGGVYCTSDRFDPFNVPTPDAAPEWPLSGPNQYTSFQQNPGTYRLVPFPQSIDPFSAGGFPSDPLRAFEQRRVQTVLSVSELYNAGLVAGSRFNSISLSMFALPTQDVFDFHLAFAWLPNTGADSAQLTRMVPGSQLQSLFNSTGIQFQYPDLYRIADQLLAFRFNALTWDGTSHLLLHFDAVANGTATSPGGIMNTYLAPTVQQPAGRTLAATNSSAWALVMDGSLLDLCSPASLSPSTWAAAGGCPTHVNASLLAPAITLFNYVSEVPVIDSITPSTSSLRGGTVVTIRGRHLGRTKDDASWGNPLIRVGALWRRLCTMIDLVNETFSVCTTAPVSPSDPQLPNDWINSWQSVAVRTDSSGMFFSNMLSFRYNQPPLPTGLVNSQNNPVLIGPVEGGYKLFVTGSFLGQNRDDLLGVYVGGLACQNPQWSSKTRVECTVPPHPTCLTNCSGPIWVDTKSAGVGYLLSPGTTSLVNFTFITGDVLYFADSSRCQDIFVQGQPMCTKSSPCCTLDFAVRPFILTASGSEGGTSSSPSTSSTSPSGKIITSTAGAALRYLSDPIPSAIPNSTAGPVPAAGNPSNPGSNSNMPRTYVKPAYSNWATFLLQAGDYFATDIHFPVDGVHLVAQGYVTLNCGCGSCISINASASTPAVPVFAPASIANITFYNYGSAGAIVLRSVKRGPLSVTAYSVTVDSCAFVHTSLLSALSASAVNVSDPAAVAAALTLGNGTALWLEDTQDVKLTNLAFRGFSVSPYWDAFPNRTQVAAASAAVQKSGGITITSSTDIFVQQCNFAGLKADFGAAIFSFSSTVTLTSSNFTNNSARVAGGAIYAVQSQFPQFVGCSFIRNFAGQQGGAIALQALPTGIIFQLSSIIFSSNFVNQTLFGSSESSANNLAGGALWLRDVDIFNSYNIRWQDNVAADGRGGAAFLDNVKRSAVVFNNQLTGNRATLQGGAFFVSNCNSFQLVSCKLINNRVNPFASDYSTAHVVSLNPDTTGGGALHAEMSVVSLFGTVFADNTVWAVGRGGALRTLFTKITGNNVAFINNSAPSGGGAMAIEIGSNLDLKSPLLFRANLAGQESRILFADAEAALSASDSQQLVNDAVSFGGGIYVSAAKAFSLRAYGVGTAAPEVQEEVFARPSLGGAFMDGLLLDSNRADYAGALYITQSMPAKLDGALFFNNYGIQGGGALAVLKSSVILNNINITSNFALEGGGGGCMLDENSQRDVQSALAAKQIHFLINVAQYANETATIPVKLTVNATLVKTWSGIYLPDCLNVMLVDSSNTRVVSESSWLVRVVLTGVKTADCAGSTISFATTPSAAPTFIGVQSTALNSGQAMFDSFGLRGQPGCSYSMRFQAELKYGTLRSDDIPITLQNCSVGQYWDELSRCWPCSAGRYSLDTSYPPLRSCSGTCPLWSDSSADGRACVCNFGNRKNVQIDPRKYPAAGDQSEAFNSACIESLSEGERTAVVVISGLVILFVLALIILIQLWKQRRAFHAASPLFCTLVALGGLFVSASALLSVLPRTPALCLTTSWLLHLGFTLCFGSLFVKTYRLSAIFSNVELRAVAITNSHLLAALAGFLAADVIILGIWLALAPPYVPPQSRLQCLTSLDYEFNIILFSAKGLVTAFGAYLTYQVRDVPSAFNESRYLAVAIYNMAFLSLVYLFVLFFFGANLNQDSLLRVEYALKLLVTVMTMLIIFVPKILIVFSDVDTIDDKGRTRSPIPTSSANATSGGFKPTSFSINNSSPENSTVGGSAGSPTRGGPGMRVDMLQKQLDTAKRQRDATLTHVRARKAALDEAHKQANEADHLVELLTAELDFLRSVRSASTLELAGGGQGTMKERMLAEAASDNEVAQGVILSSAPVRMVDHFYGRSLHEFDEEDPEHPDHSAQQISTPAGAVFSQGTFAAAGAAGAGVRTTADSTAAVPMSMGLADAWSTAGGAVSEFNPLPRQSYIQTVAAAALASSSSSSSPSLPSAGSLPVRTYASIQQRGGQASAVSSVDVVIQPSSTGSPSSMAGHADIAGGVSFSDLTWQSGSGGLGAADSSLTDSRPSSALERRSTLVELMPIGAASSFSDADSASSSSDSNIYS